MIVPFHELKEHNLIITPHHVKEKMLEELSKQITLVDIAFLDLESLMTKLTFEFNEQTIDYVMKQYQVKYEIALTYLKTLRYLKDETYHNPKLNFLAKLKEELMEKDLLEIDSFFPYYIKKRTIIIYGYDFLPPFVSSLINDRFDIKNIKQNTGNQKDFTVYEFDTQESEIEFVASQICKLLELGVKIENIKLAEIPESYHFALKRIFDCFHLPINLPVRTTLFDTHLVKRFFDLLTDDIDETLSFLEKEVTLEEQALYQQILEVVNRFSWCSAFLTIKESLTYTFKNTFKKVDPYDSAIEIISLQDNYFDDVDHIFILGFNEGVYPKIYQDDDFLTDEEKRIINLDDSTTLNQREKERVISILSRISQPTITYSFKSPFDSFHPSPLIKELNMQVVQDVPSDYRFSHLFNQITLTKYLDQYQKYGEIHPDLTDLLATYPNQEKYEHRFKGINQAELDEYLNHHLRLSFSTLDHYYLCNFRYYLAHILQLEPFEDHFSLFIGNIFHACLAKAFREDFSLDQVWDDYVLQATRSFNAKEKFLLKKLKEELRFIIDTLHIQKQSMNYPNARFEEEIVIEHQGPYPFSFKGIVDKILYKQVEDPKTCKQDTYVVLIDYKTGSIDLAIDHVKDGIKLQLPIYLYLVKHFKQLNNVKVYGFYLQHLIMNEKKADPKKPFNDIKKEHLKLQGYSLGDCFEEAEFDLSKANSQIIKSMKKNKGGSYYKYAKILTEEAIEEIIQTVENKIHQAVEDIYHAKFDINPKILNGENISCKYCKFKDICYMTYQDTVYLESTKKDQGGEEDA